MGQLDRRYMRDRKYRLFLSLRASILTQTYLLLIDRQPGWPRLLLTALTLPLFWWGLLPWPA